MSRLFEISDEDYDRLRVLYPEAWDEEGNFHPKHISSPKLGLRPVEPIQPVVREAIERVHAIFVQGVLKTSHIEWDEAFGVLEEALPLVTPAESTP